MNDSCEELRAGYLAALRPVVADALQWWAAHCPYAHTEPVPVDAMTDFHRRWIAGPAAHPRVIAVFRDYYFRIQDLNDRISSTADPDAADRQRPMDLLVNDLATVAPELFSVMQGFVYVPIGVDPDHEEC